MKKFQIKTGLCLSESEVGIILENKINLINEELVSSGLEKLPKADLVTYVASIGSFSEDLEIEKQFPIKDNLGWDRANSYVDSTQKSCKIIDYSILSIYYLSLEQSEFLNSSISTNLISNNKSVKYNLDN